jgi:hypothetical protein
LNPLSFPLIDKRNTISGTMIHTVGAVSKARLMNCVLPSNITYHYPNSPTATQAIPFPISLTCRRHMMGHLGLVCMCAKLLGRWLRSRMLMPLRWH